MTNRIDMHAHTLPPDYRASMVEHGHGTIAGLPLPEWSPEAALDFMERYGIQTQVLSVSDPGVGFLAGADARDMARYCNTYLAGLFEQYPKRFGALAVLPLPDVTASVTEVEYALDELKLDGVVLLSAYDGIYLGDPRYEPVMAALARRNAYVFVHPASLPAENKPDLQVPDFLYEFTFDTTRAATQLMFGGTMTRYPSIRFQLSHAGGTVPFLSYRLGLASELGLLPPGAVPQLISSFLYDTALSASPAAMAGVLKVTTLDHIVFGSDWPFSATLFSGNGSGGDPQPQLSESFSSPERARLERVNALRELPRLASRLS